MKPLVNATLIPGHPLARGLVNAWLLNEGGGNTANDSAAVGLGDRGIGLGISRQGGKTGTAIALNGGASSRFRIANSTNLSNTAASSIFAICTPRSTGINGNIFSKGSQGNGVALWGHLLEQTNTNSWIGAVHTGGVQTNAVGGTMTVNRSHRLCTTWTGSTRALRLYVDGVLAASQTSTGTALRHGNDSAIGSYFNNGYVTANRFNGIIDCVLRWNRELTPDEVDALMADPYQMFDRSPASGIWVPSSYAQALTLTAETGVFTVSGQDANLTPALLLDAETGQFTVTGQDADLIVVQGAEDTHDGFWRKKYREMWERKPKLPDLEEIIEAVQESPKAAIEAVPEVKQSYPDIDYTQVRANLQLQTFIAQQILVVLELRRLQDEDDIEAFLLLS